MQPSNTMTTYSNYSGIDTPIVNDGDFGFVGFNNRIRPDQLRPGLLSDAQNVRIDRNNEAQVRKGIDLIGNPLVSSGAALALPFYLIADDTTFTITINSGSLEITGVDAANFTSGNFVQLTGVTGVTPDPNTTLRPATKDSDTQITISDQAYSGTPNTASATLKYAFLNDSVVNEIYGSVAFSDPNDTGSQYIIVAANAKAVAINLSDQQITDIPYPATELVSSRAEILQAFNKVFIFREGKTALEWDGDLSGSPAFTKVPSGTYTQPVRISSAGNTVVSDGVATVSATAHGLSAGEVIEVVDAGTTGFFNNDRYFIATVPDANTFTFFATIEDQAAAEVSFMKPQSVGGGYSHMPAPPFAIYHQRRLVMPYWYSVNSSPDSFTDRSRRDELIVSNILDSDTYDTIYAQFRFNAGTADYMVGLQSFAEDRILVFNRNSIHIIQNTNDLSISLNRVLTDEVGCVARNTIVQVGNRVLFLSDNGVYGTEFIDEYNLRGTETPLSEPIDKTIGRINKAYWQNSVAVYFNNRYYIAVPLDESTKNNAILVYNFLNQQWESIDSVNDPAYDHANLIVAGEGVSRSVYSITTLGAIHKLDSRLDGIDRVVTSVGGSQKNLPVKSCVQTRQYTLGSIERKEWSEFDLHVQSSDERSSDMDITVIAENIDSEEKLGALRDYVGSELAIGEDVAVPVRIGNKRAYGIQFKFDNTSGRPRVRSLKVSGAVALRSTTKAE